MISIIIPVYNAGKFLKKTIESILNQSFPNFELILINDGSTDNSKDICTYYSKKDSRIKLKNIYNHGASYARNVGLSLATKDLITFIDADDEIDADYLQALYADYIKTATTDFVIQGMIQKWNDYKIEFTLPDNIYNLQNEDTKFFDSIFLNDLSGPYCKLYKRSIIIKNNIQFSPNIIYGEDFDFILQYLIYCNTIVTSSIKKYSYIMHSNSVSSKIYTFEQELSGLKQLHNSFNQLLKIYDNDSLSKMRLSSLIPYFWRVIYSNYRHEYSRSSRIKHLHSIPLEEIDFFKSNYRPDSLFTKIVKYFINHNKLFILDSLLYIRLNHL